MASEKIYDYVVTLKTDRRRGAFNVISHLLMLLTVTVVAYYIINLYVLRQGVLVSFGADVADPLFDRTKVTAIAAFLLLVAAWIYGSMKKKFRVGLWLSAFTWFMFGQYIPGVLYLVAGLLEHPLKQDAEIGFGSHGIGINSFPAKEYAWTEVNNVIMKDGILTVDLRNNKILQREIDEPGTQQLETEFNEFCRQRMKHREARGAVH